MTPKVQEAKAKTDKCDCIKFKSFYKAKETPKGVQRQPMEWEKVFPMCASDMGQDLEYIKNSKNSTERKEFGFKMDNGWQLSRI